MKFVAYRPPVFLVKMRQWDCCGSNQKAHHTKVCRHYVPNHSFTNYAKGSSTRYQQKPAPVHAPAVLTALEKRVLALKMEGMNSYDIAVRLNMKKDLEAVNRAFLKVPIPI